MKNSDILIPNSMLVVYINANLENRSSYSSSMSPEDVYIEYAPITDGKPGAFIPLSDDVSGKMGILLATHAKMEIGGFLPGNVIYNAFDGVKPIVCWYNKPKRRRLLYNEALGLDSLTISLPWLVWVYKDLHLSVYAAAEKPHPDIELLHAPFCNVSADGRICLGTGTSIISKGDSTYTSIINRSELAFFGTRFTDIQFESTKKNLVSLHKQLSKTKAEFPIDQLISTKKTLKKILNAEQKEEDIFSDIDEDYEDEEDDE